jgi:hypothetical protein
MIKLIALQPTLRLQCIGFMIGSSLFALGAAPVLSDKMGSEACNLSFFIGAWFFTSAAFFQLQLSGPSRNSDGALRALWLAAAVQFLGTLLFNASTAGALGAHSVHAERDLVWAPDAAGSVAFLISGAFLMLVLAHSRNLWGPVNADWASTWINMLGCVAFGLSAVGSIVLPGGGLDNPELANWGTFVGAICFFLASAITLPGASRKQPDSRGEKSGPESAPEYG